MNAIIKELDETGQLMRLMSGGFISWTIMRNKDIYLTFEVHRKTGKNYSQSVKRTADQFDMSDRHIERIVKQMQ